MVQEKRLKQIADEEEDLCRSEFEKFQKFFAYVEMELALKELMKERIKRNPSLVEDTNNPS